MSEIDAWDTMQNHQLQNHDSSSSDEDHLHPRRPRHTRSVSHPFPSLFFSSNSTTTTTSSSRKKKTTTKKGSSSPTRRHMATAGRGPDESGSESGVDVDVYAPAVRGNANANANANPSLPSVRGHHRNGSSVGGSKDFAAGRCMTCGSLVRWPRELCMFRCTICMTVNDLQPPGRDARREDGQEAAAAGLEEQPGPRGMEEVARALGFVVSMADL